MYGSRFASLRFAGAFLAAGAGALLSGILLLRHYGLDQSALGAAFCDPADAGCATVAASAWSAVGGVPLAAAGLAYFLSFGVLAGFSMLAGMSISGVVGRLAFRLVLLALVVDAFLLGVQTLAIGALCSLCLWTYVANAAILISVWPARRRVRNPSETAVERFLIRAWGLTTALIISGTLVVNDGLSKRAAAGDLSILGISSAEPAREDLALTHAGLAPAPPQWRNPTFRQQRPVKVSLEGAPVKGSANAPVKIVTFSDFLCPSCQNFARAYDLYAQGPTGPHVALYYRNYPLDTCVPQIPAPVHPGACNVARGAICAEALGGFWAYHDAVYATPPFNPSEEDVTEIAEGAGLDGAAFAACLGAAETESALQRDIGEAMRLRITSTPSIFINGRKLSSLNEFADAILWELEKAGVDVGGAPDRD